MLMQTVQTRLGHTTVHASRALQGMGPHVQVGLTPFRYLIIISLIIGNIEALIIYCLILFI